MRSISVPLAVTAGLFITASCGSRPAFKPVATIKQVMESTIVPASEAIFDSVGTVVSASGVEEIAPKNEQEWVAVRNSALTLAESGNLLMIPARAKDNGEWMKMSQALVDVGMVALKAADARNPEALFDAGGQVYVVCQQCHDKYWDASRKDK
jgi:hypothetical protein